MKKYSVIINYKLPLTIVFHVKDSVCREINSEELQSQWPIAVKKLTLVSRSDRQYWYVLGKQHMLRFSRRMPSLACQGFSPLLLFPWTDCRLKGISFLVMPLYPGKNMLYTRNKTPTSFSLHVIVYHSNLSHINWTVGLFTKFLWLWWKSWNTIILLQFFIHIFLNEQKLSIYTGEKWKILLRDSCTPLSIRPRQFFLF